MHDLTALCHFHCRLYFSSKIYDINVETERKVGVSGPRSADLMQHSFSRACHTASRKRRGRLTLWRRWQLVPWQAASDNTDNYDSSSLDILQQNCSWRRTIDTTDAMNYYGASPVCT